MILRLIRDFRREARFLWMMPFLTALSSLENSSLDSLTASSAFFSRIKLLTLRLTVFSSEMIRTLTARRRLSMRIFFMDDLRCAMESLVISYVCVEPSATFYRK